MRTGQIFLAEDEQELRRLVAGALRADGHEVHEIARGDELLHAIIVATDQRKVPDLLVSDVHMPGMSAVEALELVRPQVPSLPVVLMTAAGDSDLIARAAKLNVACIFRKPFALDAMRAAVISLLGTMRGTSQAER
jgi:DNA-binding NtrC family response regulator